MAAPDLPIQDVVPHLLNVLRDSGRAVLHAPPGAGKTTRVPLEMLQAGLFSGRLIMLEPRRLATRAAAERMASVLGEPVGQTVGYRVRGEARVSKATRIEVVTEGILTRVIQSDPSLQGIGAIVFDEFHERSLNADLGLALCLEIAEALRDDLLLLVMSATLNAAPVADLMNAPVVTSEGRSFPVDIRYLDKPLRAGTRFEDALADLTLKAAKENEGGLLIFAPGEREIRQVAARLSGRLSAKCVVRPLYGAMPFVDQQSAIAPIRDGRKVVLATSIAETSLTIEDIRVVVDGGKARRARFDPSSAMTRLVTEPASRAETDQRAGRAGRLAPGTCYRLWTVAEHGARIALAPPEIERADLSGLALELALWGATPDTIPFLSPPNDGVYNEACGLLRLLDALNSNNRITEHGRALAALPVHPRLAHMLVRAGPSAALLVALLSEKDPMPRGSPVDLALRLAALRGRAETPRLNPGIRKRITSEAARLNRQAPRQEVTPLSDAQMAALAYPDRIGLRRKGGPARFILSGGKGAAMADHDPLAGQRLIVASDLDGNLREARIRQAIALSEADLRGLMSDRIAWHDVCQWDRRRGRVRSRREERLGALVLDERIWKDPPCAAVGGAMLEGVRALGLTWSDASRRFADRVLMVRETGADLPDLDEKTLLATLEHWLLPYLEGIRSAEAWKNFDILPALRAMLDWKQLTELDRAAPAHFTTPLGRKVPIEYDKPHPEISLRLQEMFGQTRHPQVAGQPLRVTLLSPAGRPVQTTMDLPGFWTSSYADVRKDMRGRYPKHPWPEDPTEADPTLRAKQRGT
ncbi:MAG: ATP-dependent helicase HrpB [Pseudomonadota bacterium]